MKGVRIMKFTQARTNVLWSMLLLTVMGADTLYTSFTQPGVDLSGIIGTIIGAIATMGNSFVDSKESAPAPSVPQGAKAAIGSTTLVPKTFFATVKTNVFFALLFLAGLGEGTLWIMKSTLKLPWLSGILGGSVGAISVMGTAMADDSSAAMGEAIKDI